MGEALALGARSPGGGAPSPRRAARTPGSRAGCWWREVILGICGSWSCAKEPPAQLVHRKINLTDSRISSGQLTTLPDGMGLPGRAEPAITFEDVGETTHVKVGAQKRPLLRLPHRPCCLEVARSVPSRYKGFLRGWEQSI